MPIARPGHWWLILGTGHEIGFTSLHVYASTSTEDHLYMAWALHKPVEREIWRIVRGKRVFCGIKYIWDTPYIAEQSQEGDTLFHSFYISGLPALRSVWYYLNAPAGPYGYEIQGPLMHVELLRAETWSHHAYFASRSKGMFKTRDNLAPGAPQPTWIPDNAGLPFLDIAQACPDPWDPYHRRFILVHGDVYRMDNTFIDDPATATLVLSWLDALNLTGSTDGLIHWIAGNRNYQGHFYVLFCSNYAGTGIWCLKTINYGASWTVHCVESDIRVYTAGNIMAGDAQGESPYAPGDVLYATIIYGPGGNFRVRRSFDEGESWAPTPAPTVGVSIWRPRLYVDPSDQSTLYTGAETGGRDLWRTLNHGESWSLCDQGNQLGIVIERGPLYATMGTRASDKDAIRVLKNQHIWRSSDFGEIWRDQGETQYQTPHLHYKDQAPDFLYLARIYDAPTADGLYAPHVIFVSNDEGSNMFGKAGAHPLEDHGRYDSIPYNCGGVANQGILTLP